MQALAVKGKPEALRQAISAAKDSSSHESTTFRSFKGEIGAVRNHAESDKSHPPGVCNRLKKGKPGSSTVCRFLWADTISQSVFTDGLA